jgi:hypothetical protein
MRTTLPLGSFFFFLFLHLTAFVCLNSPLYSLTTVVCPVRHTLSVMSTPLSLPWCPVQYPFNYFTLLLLGGVCPVRHPFNYHYFTFNYGVFVRFDILSIYHYFSLLLGCPSGSLTLSIVITFSFPTVSPLCHPFDYYHHYGNEFESNSFDTMG